MKDFDAIKAKKEEMYDAVASALSSGNEEAVVSAMKELQEYNKQELLDLHAEFEQTHDEAVLEARGVKALTSEETKFWNKFIDVARADFNNSITGGVYTGLMEQLPKTEYESIIEELRREHPLLNAINFTSTSAVTKWTIDNSAEQRATWKPLNSAIEAELLGGPFITIDMTLCKLAAFMVVSNDMLDLGPRWVASYALTMLKESIALGLEYAVVCGTGKDEPIGMVRNYAAPKDPTTGYPKKDAIKVTSFSKETYGSLLSVMAQKDNGRTRKINGVVLIVNPTDYFTKIFPATTAMTTGMSYVTDIFPYPTQVIQSTFVDSGEAIMGIASDYFMGLGSAKGGNIETSDHARFFEDQRAYKIKLYGNGQPKQKNGFLRLDITDVEEVFPIVATTDVPKSALLTSLVLDGIDVTPTFDKLKRNYTATTTKATSTITVAAKDGDATVVIKNGDTTIQNGGSVTITNNAVTTLKITVTNGDAEAVYTVAITRGTPAAG